MRFHITSVSGRPKHTPQVKITEKVKATNSQQRCQSCLALLLSHILSPRPLPPRERKML